MKISTLIDYLEKLSALELSVIQTQTLHNLDVVAHMIQSSPVQYTETTQQLNDNLANVGVHVSEFLATVAKLKQQVIANIEQLEPKYLADSYQLYSTAMVNDLTGYVLDRRPVLTQDMESLIRARIMVHSDWHHAGLIIRPGLENWIDDLVALDPMYIADIRDDLLDPAWKKFNPDYQRRIRKYIIKEAVDQPILGALPTAQFGFILVYNYFEYKAFEIVKRFLDEIYDCLKPGGTVAFTFNNCDRPGAVELSERSFKCYTPGRLVLSGAREKGYEIVNTFNVDAAVTWVELRRPGELKSLRGGQSLARIIAKPANNLYN